MLILAALILAALILAALILAALILAALILAALINIQKYIFCYTFLHLFSFKKPYLFGI